MARIVIGIDPGKSGGLAAINKDGELKVHNCPNDNNAKTMTKILKRLINKTKIKDVDVVIEHVWGFPGDSSMAAFKFGQNFGIWLGIIGAMGLSSRKVAPKTWQKEYTPLPKTKKERKNALKQLARDIYPRATLKTADAILIAMWGMNNAHFKR